MNPQQPHKAIPIVIGVLVMVCAFAIGSYYKNQTQDIPNPPTTTAQTPLPVVTVSPPPPAPLPKGAMYHKIMIATENPQTELAQTVDADNVQAVLETNRIDIAHITKGTALIVPNNFSNTSALSPFPAKVKSATTIPKLMLVSNEMQAFGVYEYGKLVRWGATSTGKQSTPTPDYLYFVNWKAPSAISTEDDTWILPWYINLDNTSGISMHQYDMSGYPASHACIRFLQADAEWIYNWVDQWTVAPDGQTVLSNGTPVIVFGNYAYGKEAPWNNLVANPHATDIDADALEKTVDFFLARL